MGNNALLTPSMDWLEKRFQNRTRTPFYSGLLDHNAPRFDWAKASFRKTRITTRNMPWDNRNFMRCGLPQSMRVIEYIIDGLRVDILPEFSPRAVAECAQKVRDRGATFLAEAEIDSCMKEGLALLEKQAILVPHADPFCKGEHTNVLFYRENGHFDLNEPWKAKTGEHVVLSCQRRVFDQNYVI